MKPIPFPSHRFADRDIHLLIRFQSPFNLLGFGGIDV